MEKPLFSEVMERNAGMPVLMKLYFKGRLGRFPEAEFRLKAGLMFISDYHRSVFSQKITRNYDRFFVVGNGAKTDTSSFRYDAADRYLKALKSTEPYGVYALHFLRDDENVRSFLSKYPILNQGKRRTYNMVYRALCQMLDKLIVFYDRSDT